MKKFLIFLLCFSFLAVAVSADELEGDLDNRGEWYVAPEDIVIGQEVVVDVGEYGVGALPSEPVQDDPVEDAPEVEKDILYFDNVSTDLNGVSGAVSVASLNPIRPSDTSGLKAALLGILGPYDAIVVEYQNGNYTSREVFQDDVWLCSFWLLAIMIFCLFKLLGGWLTRKQ